MILKKLLPPSISWAIYDFANTIFSAAVITLYFPLYFTKLTGANTYLGIATTLAMVLAGLATPIAGRICDQTKMPKRYLQRMTFACIGCTFLLALFKQPLILFFTFILACFFFHLCLVFYNALLPNIAAEKQQGRISGFGVGLGYLGIVISLPLMHFVESSIGMRWVFLVTALLFLLFSLPLFKNVTEKETTLRVSWNFRFMVNEWQGIYATFLHICRKPKILLFFGGNFFALDALNSTIAWFAVYSKTIFELEQSQLILLMIALNASAFLFGLVAGFFTDKINGYFILTSAAIALALLLYILTQQISFLHSCQRVCKVKRLRS